MSEPLSPKDTAYWLLETWKLIEECASRNDPKHSVGLTNLGCAALLEEHNGLKAQMRRDIFGTESLSPLTSGHTPQTTDQSTGSGVGTTRSEEGSD